MTTIVAMSIAVVETPSQLRAAMAHSRRTREYFPVRVSPRKVLQIAVVPLAVAIGIATTPPRPNTDPRLRAFVAALADCIIGDLAMEGLA